MLMCQKDTCTPIFTAVLFTIARSWKQPKCPLTEKWIKKMWYMYTMEYYSAIKRNEIGSFVEMWMDLETVFLVNFYFLYFYFRFSTDNHVISEQTVLFLPFQSVYL